MFTYEKSFSWELAEERPRSSRWLPNSRLNVGQQFNIYTRLGHWLLFFIHISLTNLKFNIQETGSKAFRLFLGHLGVSQKIYIKVTCFAYTCFAYLYKSNMFCISVSAGDSDMNISKQNVHCSLNYTMSQKKRPTFGLL